MPASNLRRRRTKGRHGITADGGRPEAITSSLSTTPSVRRVDRHVLVELDVLVVLHALVELHVLVVLHVLHVLVVFHAEMLLDMLHALLAVTWLMWAIAVSHHHYIYILVVTRIHIVLSTDCYHYCEHHNQSQNNLLHNRKVLKR